MTVEQRSPQRATPVPGVTVPPAAVIPNASDIDNTPSLAATTEAKSSVAETTEATSSPTLLRSESLASSSRTSPIPTSSSDSTESTTSASTTSDTTTSSRSALPTGVFNAATTSNTTQSSTATESAPSSTISVSSSSTTSWSSTSSSTTAWESSSSPPEWTSSSWVEPAPPSQTWSPPAETWSSSSSSWSDWHSSSSSSVSLTSSTSTSTTAQPTLVEFTLGLAADTTLSASPEAEPTESPSPVNMGTLTNSGHTVSATDLITDSGKSAEAANGEGGAQAKKVAGMNVGAFIGLILALLLAIVVAGYFFANRWHKKKRGDSTPLWRHFVDKMRDKDPNDEKRPFTQYTMDPFADEMRAPAKRASSFFNSSWSSKYTTPVTPHENFAGRGNVWPAPLPPALTETHPRASRYMPTSGRAVEPVPLPSSAIEPSRPESDEILANYYPDSEYQDDGPKRFTSTSKRKTAMSSMSDGSVYSVDSIWGNASEMPPTARSSFSYSPWRRSSAPEEPPAVPPIPNHLAAGSRLSRFRKSSSYERLQDASEPPMRLPPRPAMAQTPTAVRQKPGFGEGGFVLPLGGFSR